LSHRSIGGSRRFISSYSVTNLGADLCLKRSLKEKEQDERLESYFQAFHARKVLL
jgi:hypothetical protein